MSITTRLLLGLALATASLAAGASEPHAKSFEVLYRFTGRPDGAVPYGDLVLQNGALYGTTYDGGAGSGPTVGLGTVFKFDLATGTLTTLHGFTGGADGGSPFAGVVFDSAGMLYGTTSYGGGPAECGTAYKLDPSAGTFTVLHAFQGRGGGEGCGPVGKLTFSNGVLYGTTYGGGGGFFPSGTVFALDSATHKLTTLHDFCPVIGCPDGADPDGGVVSDAAGMLYGTTFSGYGTLFQLDPSTRAFVTLYTFDPRGYQPSAGLVVRNGRLFGTTNLGILYNHGSMFRFDLAARHFRTEHFFGESGLADGSEPNTLTADPTPGSGLLFGITTEGGNQPAVCFVHNGCGTVFEFKAGHRTLTTLHAFSGPDGANPYGAMALDAPTATLYGTTLNGGYARGGCKYIPVEDGVGCGTIFKLVP